MMYIIRIVLEGFQDELIHYGHHISKEDLIFMKSNSDFFRDYLSDYIAKSVSDHLHNIWKNERTIAEAERIIKKGD